MALLHGWIKLDYLLCCGLGIIHTPAGRARGLIAINALILPYCLFDIYCLLLFINLFIEYVLIAISLLLEEIFIILLSQAGGVFSPA